MRASEPGTSRALIDPSQLTNAVLNLALNARDAMPEHGTLSIGVAVTSVDAMTARANPGLMMRDYVTITVSDTGCGMPQDVQAHIFEPFFTTKDKGQGTGLGLATCYGIPVVRGPDDLKDLPRHFNRAAAPVDLSRYEIKMFAEIVDAPHLDVATIVEENVTGTRVVKSFAAEPDQIRLLAKAAERLRWAASLQVDIRAKVDSLDGRKLWVSCACTAPDGTVTFTAKALFLQVSLSHFAKAVTAGGQDPVAP